MCFKNIKLYYKTCTYVWSGNDDYLDKNVRLGLYLGIPTYIYIYTPLVPSSARALTGAAGDLTRSGPHQPGPCSRATTKKGQIPPRPPARPPASQPAIATALSLPRLLFSSVYLPIIDVQHQPRFRGPHLPNQRDQKSMTKTYIPIYFASVPGCTKLCSLHVLCRPPSARWPRL